MDADALDRAAAALNEGLVVVLPTDTVYGVAARPDRVEGVEGIFTLKGRERDKALPVLGADVESLTSVVEFDDRAQALADRYWPGALTLVLKRAHGFTHDLGAGGTDSVAVRVPGAEVTRSLLATTGPLAVTSANPSGAPPALTVDEARAMFGDRVPVYVDGGPSPGGRASTVVSLVKDLSVLRPGPIAEEDLRRSLSS